MNKEVNDALHTLLNLSLKDKSFSTQKEQFKIVYDYITNLQEENMKLFTQLEDRAYEQIKFQWKDYKSRCEKAIEYIKEDMYDEPNELYGLVDGEHLLNILTGGDKE